MKIMTKDNNTTLTLNDKQFGIIMTCLAFSYAHRDMMDSEVTWTKKDILDTSSYLLYDVLHVDDETTIFPMKGFDNE